MEHPTGHCLPYSFI